MSTALPTSNIPLFDTVASFRQWRTKAAIENKSVGFVATMGALHEGHMSLVRRSLAENNLTVLSIFVNPAQFAPHEDLATYPRTLPKDLELLSTVSGVSAVLVPTVPEMYPSGITQDRAAQKGAFVEVNGFAHQMEGASRPTFFRGVATVVTKLFNVIQPTNTYFGQKDIQQALLLRRMSKDLLLPVRLHIVPTTRAPLAEESTPMQDGLALSSRNAYLSPSERLVAGTLYAALRTGKSAWEQGSTKSQAIDVAKRLVAAAIHTAEGVDMRLDYIEINDADSLDIVEDAASKDAKGTVIISGALWVGKTRLIDNVILGDENVIFG